MGLLHKLLGRSSANKTVERAGQLDARAEDLLLRERELQARVAEMIEGLEQARARIRELGRRYPYTS
jgi:HPt (histidine-containing phosphotransfer) domain-containing protein